MVCRAISIEGLSEKSNSSHDTVALGSNSEWYPPPLITVPLLLLLLPVPVDPLPVPVDPVPPVSGAEPDDDDPSRAAVPSSETWGRYLPCAAPIVAPAARACEYDCRVCGLLLSAMSTTSGRVR